MARRVIGSGNNGATESNEAGRTIQSRARVERQMAEKSSPRQARSIVSDETTDSSRSEDFVDARKLRSENLITKTLDETTGTLGLLTRPKVVDFSSRLEEKRKANIRVITIRVAGVAAAVAIMTMLVWLFFFSSVFRLETSEITIVGGNEWVSDSQVMEIAEKQAGKSILLVSNSNVEKEIKEIPGVTSAEAKKVMPNKLEVTFKAQKPAAMLKTGENSMTAVDSKGRVLNSVEGVSVDGIPVIEVEDVETSLKNRSIKEALKILSSLSESMRNSITKVTAATQDSITTELNGGDQIIVWGDSSEMKLKKAVVDKIINDPNVIGDKHNVDVSAPLRPIIK